jgi:hypothetical protein
MQLQLALTMNLRIMISEFAWLDTDPIPDPFRSLPDRVVREGLGCRLTECQPLGSAKLHQVLIENLVKLLTFGATSALAGDPKLCDGAECYGTPLCSNGWDNDGDGLVDYGRDPGCASTADNDEYNAPAPPPPPPPPTACSDGIDNDGDGFNNYGSDPGCASGSDNDEWNDWGHWRPWARPDGGQRSTPAGRLVLPRTSGTQAGLRPRATRLDTT